MFTKIYVQIVFTYVIDETLHVLISKLTVNPVL